MNRKIKIISVLALGLSAATAVQAGKTSTNSSKSVGGLSNFEIQDMMSRINQAEFKKSTVLRFKARGANAVPPTDCPPAPAIECLMTWE